MRTLLIALALTASTASVNVNQAVTPAPAHRQSSTQYWDQNLQRMIIFQEIDSKQIQSKELSSRCESSTDFTLHEMSFNATAYTSSYQDCGNTKGITASGKHAQVWHTIAAPSNMPFGTKLYIPYFKDAPNHGMFVVEDRGSAITYGHLDVFMSSDYQARKFGRKQLKVYLVEMTK